LIIESDAAGLQVDTIRMASDKTYNPDMVSQRTGPDTPAEAVAEIAVRAWQRLADRLTVVIGERGFRVLYGRSVHLIRADFPWLAPPSPQSDAPEPLFAGLRQSLEVKQPALAADAQRALLRTFTGLLGSLIGEVLTARLVREALPDGGPDGLADVVLEVTRISVQEAPSGGSADERSQESSNDR
jgi:hypothetical protein